MGEARRRIELYGALEQCNRLLAVVTRRSTEVPEPAEGIVPRSQVGRRLPHRTVGHVLEQLRTERDRDRLSNLVTGLEHIVQCRAPAVGPERLGGPGVWQPYCDWDPLVEAPQAPH